MGNTLCKRLPGSQLGDPLIDGNKVSRGCTSLPCLLTVLVVVNLCLTSVVVSLFVELKHEVANAKDGITIVPQIANLIQSNFDTSTWNAALTSASATLSKVQDINWAHSVPYTTYRGDGGSITITPDDSNSVQTFISDLTQALDSITKALSGSGSAASSGDAASGRRRLNSADGSSGVDSDKICSNIPKPVKVNTSSLMYINVPQFVDTVVKSIPCVGCTVQDQIDLVDNDAIAGVIRLMIRVGLLECDEPVIDKLPVPTACVDDHANRVWAWREMILWLVKQYTATLKS